MRILANAGPPDITVIPPKSAETVNLNRKRSVIELHHGFFGGFRLYFVAFAEKSQG